MQLPTISQYAGTVADPDGLTRTLGDFAVERDNYGEVKIRSGNNACVFRITSPAGDRMLKCYVKPRSDLAELYGYISSLQDELIGNIALLSSELFVFDHFGGGGWYDVVCGQWVEGPTLHTAVQRACRENDRQRLASLSCAFDRLALKLIGKEWAHGDLKPENIIVRGDGSLALVDFDALYYPGNPSPSGFELGTPGFQHPGRTAGLYDKCLDDYPVAIISASLKALSLDPGLYQRFNAADMMIMNPVDILNGSSPAYPEVKSLLACADTLGHFRLALLLASHEPAIDGLEGILERIVDRKVPDGNETVFDAGGYFGYEAAGSRVVDAVFDEACEFRDGVALVCINGNKKLYDGRRFLLEEICYDDIKPFSEGLAAFHRSGMWGYADRDGKIVIEPQYDMAGNMHCGIAAVCLGGSWGYIDKSGRPVTGFIFDRALGFRGNSAIAYKDGEVICIGTGGEILSRDKG